MAVNENNYIGATVTLVGYAAGEAKPPAYDKDGSRGVLEVSIPISEGYKKDGEFVQTGTTWYRYSARGDYANALRAVNKGDKIRIDNAKQEVREYTDKDNKTVQSIGLVFGTLTVLSSKQERSSDFVPAGANADPVW
jgi:hypothetical protein